MGYHVKYSNNLLLIRIILNCANGHLNYLLEFQKILHESASDTGKLNKVIFSGIPRLVYLVDSTRWLVYIGTYNSFQFNWLIISKLSII